MKNLALNSDLAGQMILKGQGPKKIREIKCINFTRNNFSNQFKISQLDKKFREIEVFNFLVILAWIF